MILFDSNRYLNALSSLDPIQLKGKITQIIGLVVEAEGPSVSLGELCYISSKKKSEPIMAEVVGFRHNRVLLKVY